MILYCRNAFTIASGSRGSLTVSPIFLVLRSRSHRVDCAGFFEPQCDHERPAEPLPDGLCTHAGWRPSGKEPQRVVRQAYALMDCGARARSATRAVDRAGVVQDTQQFRLRSFALVRREPW